MPLSLCGLWLYDTTGKAVAFTFYIYMTLNFVCPFSFFTSTCFNIFHLKILKINFVHKYGNFTQNMANFIHISHFTEIERIRYIDCSFKILTGGNDIQVLLGRKTQQLHFRLKFNHEKIFITNDMRLEYRN